MSFSGSACRQLGYWLAAEPLIDKLPKEVGEWRNILPHACLFQSGQNRCKGFIQKADHTCGTMLKIAMLFYNNLGGGFESLAEFSARKYGKNDPFTQFLISVAHLLTFIRDTRNAVEHPQSNQRCTVTDFALRPDGKLVVPIIEVEYRSRQYPPVPVSECMGRITDQLPEIFEVMMAYMCRKHVEPFAGFPIQVAEVPEKQRAERYVRFSYVATINGQIVPIS